MTRSPSIPLRSVLAALEAQLLTDRADAELRGCYISDLLSDVLAHADPGVLWVTIQTHRNVVSVASMKEVAAVLFSCGRQPDTAIIAEAEAEGIVLLTTPLTTFHAAAKLWEAGIR